MDLTFECSVRVKCEDVHKEQAVRDAITTCPRLLTAVMVCQDSGWKSHSRDVIRLLELLKHISPSYPNEVTDSITLAALLKGDVHFDKEEYDILKNLLPDTRDLSVKLSSLGTQFRIRFDVSPKDAGHFEVSFYDDCGPRFPMTIGAQRWANMDYKENHYDWCDDASDCDCVPEIVDGDTMEIRTYEEWKKGGEEKVRAFIHKIVGF